MEYKLVVIVKKKGIKGFSKDFSADTDEKAKIFSSVMVKLFHLENNSIDFNNFDCYLLRRENRNLTIISDI